MRTWTIAVTLLAVTAGLTLFGAQATAKGPGPGGEMPDTGELYSDLWIVLRDLDGVPILDMNGCEQPVSAEEIPGKGCITNEVDGTDVWLIDLMDPLEAECEVNPEHLAYLQYVDLGRLNKGRSPERVLSKHLGDVEVLLTLGLFGLDEAGRFVVAGGIVIEKPGYNLAIYQSLMEKGMVGSQDVSFLPLPNPLASIPQFEHAAAAFGGAADITIPIGVDTVIYMNAILGIPLDTTFAPTVEGNAEGEWFIDYGAYGYERATVFPGCIRGYLADFPADGIFTPFEGAILDCVFGSITYDAENDIGVCHSPPPEENVYAYNLHGFAHRADDARAVIAFMQANAIASSTAILDPSVAGIDVVGSEEVCSYLGE